MDSENTSFSFIKKSISTQDWIDNIERIQQSSELTIFQCNFQEDDLFFLSELSFKRVSIDHSFLTLKGLRLVLSSIRPESLNILSLKGNNFHDQTEDFLSTVKDFLGSGGSFGLNELDISENNIYLNAKDIEWINSKKVIF